MSSLAQFFCKDLRHIHIVQVSIHGSYGRPTVRDTLAYQIVMAPWWLAKVRSLHEVHSSARAEVIFAQDMVRAAVLVWQS
jgi:hypothetical protein